MNVLHYECVILLIPVRVGAINALYECVTLFHDMLRNILLPVAVNLILFEIPSYNNSRNALRFVSI